VYSSWGQFKFTRQLISTQEMRLYLQTQSSTQRLSGVLELNRRLHVSQFSLYGESYMTVAE
jgi:hypothetical protein